MGHTTTTITAPVSVADVKYVLMSNSNDVGTLCTSGNINKTARHKPLCFPFPDVTSLDDSTYAIEKNRYANGMDYYGNVGGLISAQYAATASALSSLGQGYIFAHAYPNFGGNTTDYYRLIDFNNYWHEYTYIFSGKVPFFATVTTESPKLGGTVTLALTLGSYEKPDDESYILSGNELAQLSSKYFGLLFTRPNGNTNNNSQQYGGNDYLMVTTDRVISQFSSGLTTILNGICDVYKADEYHYTFTFKIPSNSLGLLTLTSANFDNFVGSTIQVKPIMTDGVFNFWDEGSTSTKVWPLAFSSSYFDTLEFILQSASYNPLYKRPDLTLTFTSSKSGSVYIFNQFTITIKNNSATGRYFVRIVSVSFMVEYLNDSVWAMDGNASMTWHEYGLGVYINAGGTGTYTKADGISYTPTHPTASLRVTPSVYLEITDDTGASQTEYYTIASKTMN